MIDRNNTALDTETKSELTEWMVGLLLSDDRPSEDTLDEIRLFIADYKDSELKQEVLGKLFQKAFESRNSDASAVRSAMTAEMWPRIADALGMDPDLDRYRAAQTPDTAIKPLRRPVWRRAAMRVAAVMIPMMVVAGAAWLWLERSGILAPQLVANVEISVPEGGQKRIVLPDGSQVWANSSTTITYNDDFSKERAINLDGEAFFSVVRDPLAPFHVRGADMAIEVLGTEFNVKARRDEPTAEVVLVSGSVEVKTPRNKAIKLLPNERLTFHAASFKTIVDEVAAEMVSTWRVTDLRMEGMPLAEALAMIAAYYGRDLSIVGTLPEGDIIDFAPAGEMPVEQILDVVRSITGSFNYQLSEHEIIAHPLSLQNE